MSYNWIYNSRLNNFFFLRILKAFLHYVLISGLTVEKSNAILIPLEATFFLFSSLWKL